jgi:hypothetical protein
MRLCELISNKGWLRGGAMKISNSSVNILSSKFFNNEMVGDCIECSQVGGAVYIDSSETIRIRNTRFENNKSFNTGGKLKLKSRSVIHYWEKYNY